MARAVDQHASALISYKADLPNPIRLRDVPVEVLAKVEKKPKIKKKRFGSEIPAGVQIPKKRQKTVAKNSVLKKKKKTLFADDVLDEDTEAAREVPIPPQPIPDVTQQVPITPQPIPDDTFSHVLENPLPDTFITTTPPSSQPNVPLPLKQTT